MAFSKNTRQKPEIISYRTIRRSIGYLGIVLPFSLLFFSYLLGCRQMQPSISHYYYTTVGSIFVGILCAVGLFLITYKGFSPLDDFATNLAGFFAFGIAFFPTGEFETSCCALYRYPQSDLRSVIHFGCAACFFLTLSYISYFLFTISHGHTITKEKVQRNIVYRVCAVLMIVSIALIPMKFNPSVESLNPTFWLETFALISFGISWLVKGEVVLKDNP